MDDLVQRLYADRDHQSQGGHYLRHVSAMTAEGLHAKSEIAGELAHRDMEIERLRAELDALRADAVRYRWMRDCDTVSVHRGSLWLEGISNLDAAIDAAMAQKEQYDPRA